MGTLAAPLLPFWVAIPGLGSGLSAGRLRH